MAKLMHSPLVSDGFRHVAAYLQFLPYSSVIHPYEYILTSMADTTIILVVMSIV